MQTAEQLKTLDTLGLLEILWELFAKKSAVILSFRHSFTLSRQRGKGKTLSLKFSLLSVSKEKHDQVFSAALLNGRKIQISLQLLDPGLTWRVASMPHWTLNTLTKYFISVPVLPI